MLEHMVEHMDIFMCPSCGKNLTIVGEGIRCSGCGKDYKVEAGIPLLFSSRELDQSGKDVTAIVKSFYEQTPFPNYEDFEDVGDLIQKAQKGVFARLLNEQVPFNVRVLEAGCGTGQLSNFLGIAQRFVFGVDMCVNSLKLAQKFKLDNDLKRVGFYQMNLFRPIFKEETFPLVISNGVLHHTSDPFSAFQSISKLVKKGGYIVIGLYNKYGRVATDVRRCLFNIFGDRCRFLDRRLKKDDVSDLRKLTWFMDQYKNPHESKHTMGEVLRWFDQTGFEFVNGIPKYEAFKNFLENEKLFESNPKGSWFDHGAAQTQLMFTGSAEGGFFVTIGKKKF